MLARKGLSSSRTWESGKAERSGSAPGLLPPSRSAAPAVDAVVDVPVEAACADGSMGEGSAVTAAAAEAANTI
jgi:hypothetical protein